MNSSCENSYEQRMEPTWQVISDMLKWPTGQFPPINMWNNPELTEEQYQEIKSAAKTWWETGRQELSEEETYLIETLKKYNITYERFAEVMSGKMDVNELAKRRKKWYSQLVHKQTDSVSQLVDENIPKD